MNQTPSWLLTAAKLSLYHCCPRERAERRLWNLSPVITFVIFKAYTLYSLFSQVSPRIQLPENERTQRDKTLTADLTVSPGICGYSSSLDNKNFFFKLQLFSLFVYLMYLNIWCALRIRSFFFTCWWLVCDLMNSCRRSVISPSLSLFPSLLVQVIVLD